MGGGTEEERGSGRESAHLIFGIESSKMREQRLTKKASRRFRGLEIVSALQGGWGSEVIG